MRRSAVSLAVLGIAVVIGCGSSSGPSSNDATGGAKASDEIDIVGEYAYKQTGPQGASETGTVAVKKHDDTYTVLWTRADGKTYSGVGVRTKDTLSVCYSYPGAGERGNIVYKIVAGPKLDGQWATLEGDGKLYPDNWTPKK